jgi:hypothetical protein
MKKNIEKIFRLHTIKMAAHIKKTEILTIFFHDQESTSSINFKWDL